MIWIVVPTTILLIWWVTILRGRRLPFWDLVAEYPAEAIAFFDQSPHVYWDRPQDTEVVGPFVVVPPGGSGRAVFISARHIDRVEREFVAQMNRAESRHAS